MALRIAAFGCTLTAKKKYSSIIVPSSFGFGNSGFKPSPYSQPGLLRSIRAINQEIVLNPTTSKKEDEEQSPNNWKIKMLYDGDCPLCMREVNMLRERNVRYRTIKFVDISSDDYSLEENQGLDYKTVMGRIHAILADGTVVTDVEAFRRLYEEVGLGWVYAITKYEPIATIADAVYGVWAKYRLQITGRPGLEEILEARKKTKVGKGKMAEFPLLMCGIQAINTTEILLVNTRSSLQ